MTHSVEELGRVASLHIAQDGGVEMQTIERARIVSGRGIEGDRYFHGRGTYSDRPGTGRQITLIENEALEALQLDYRIAIAAALARRNIVTTSVRLNHLVGREFRAGPVLLRGMRLCDPCAHLERLTAPGILRALVHRGGLRADVLSGGLIRVGDRISLSGAAH